MKHFYHLFFITTILMASGVYGQNEQAELEDAIKAFEHDYFEDAIGTFEKLYKLKPKDAAYNFWYGACLIETQRSDPESYLKYLQFASEQGCKQELAPYYLGRALQQNFKFNEALIAFKNFLNNPGKNKHRIKDAEKRIIDCEYALSLDDPHIFDALLFQEHIKTNGLYRYYQSLSFPGNITFIPKDLESYKDQKSGEISFAFITQEKDRIFYSSYENEKDRDIYYATIDHEGNFSEPIRLSEVINTDGNESFPVFNSQEQSLYFSSTGHPGIGGSDLFIAKYNAEDDSWEKAVNLGFPINSVFDDYLFVKNSVDSKQAYYATNRFDVNEYCHVFNILLKDGNQPIAAKENHQEITDHTEELITETEEQVDQQNQFSEEEEENLTVKQKAEKKLWEKEMANTLTDSAFAYISLCSDKIDALEAQLNRAMLISNTQSTKSKALFKQYFNDSRNFCNQDDISSINIITHQLKQLEEDAISCKIRSDQAQQTAVLIKQQIDVSKETQNQLKDKAAAIQLSAAQDPLEQVENLFNDFISFRNTSDTLKDYNEYLDLVAYDKSKLALPQESIINVIQYLKNQSILQQNTALIPESKHNEYSAYLTEANSLIHMAINSYEKACSGVQEDKYTYIIADAKMFSAKSLEEQQNALNLFDYNLAFEEEAIIVDNKQEEDIEIEKQKIVSETRPENTTSTLIYKIKLGAFGKKPSQAVLAGIDKLSTEAVPGSSLTRYYAGDYNTIEEAEQARLQLNNRFPGAFVVAYKDGIKTDIKEDSHQTKTTKTVKKPSQPGKDVSKIKGRQYYLQLGTFSSLKNSADLYQVDPLFTEKINNGMTRYFAGPYSSETEAKQELSTLQSKGATNAFIVLYLDGVKQDFEPATPKVDTPEVVTETSENEIVLKIQLGAFSQQKSSAWKQEMSQRTGSPIDEFKTGSGIYIYATGSFVDLNAADTFKKQLINKGLDGVFVAAFQNGKKITMEQALKMLK